MDQANQPPTLHPETVEPAVSQPTGPQPTPPPASPLAIPQQPVLAGSKKPNKLPLVFGGVVGVLVLVVIIAVVAGGGNTKQPTKTATTTTATSSSANQVQAASALDVEQVNNGITQDLSGLNDRADLGSDSLTDQSFGL